MLPKSARFRANQSYNMTKPFPRDSNIEIERRRLSRLSEELRQLTGDWSGRLTLIFVALTLARPFYFRYRRAEDEDLDIVTGLISIETYFNAFLIALRVFGRSLGSRMIWITAGCQAQRGGAP